MARRRVCRADGGGDREVAERRVGGKNRPARPTRQRSGLSLSKNRLPRPPPATDPARHYSAAAATPCLSRCAPLTRRPNSANLVSKRKPRFDFEFTDSRRGSEEVAKGAFAPHPNQRGVYRAIFLISHNIPGWETLRVIYSISVKSSVSLDNRQ